MRQYNPMDITQPFRYHTDTFRVRSSGETSEGPLRMGPLRSGRILPWPPSPQAYAFGKCKVHSISGRAEAANEETTCGKNGRIVMAESFFEQPILNSPYEYPGRHWELDESWQPTNKIVERRLGGTVGLRQKGVVMRIGLDIASITLKQQAETIILIAGDSDFVPATKLARREGVEFIPDPLWQQVNDDLFEHIDGLQSVLPKPKSADEKNASRGDTAPTAEAEESE